MRQRATLPPSSAFRRQIGSRSNSAATCLPISQAMAGTDLLLAVVKATRQLASDPSWLAFSAINIFSPWHADWVAIRRRIMLLNWSRDLIGLSEVTAFAPSGEKRRRTIRCLQTNARREGAAIIDGKTRHEGT